MGVDKFSLGIMSLPFLGYIIHWGELFKDPEKIAAIRSHVPQETHTKVRAFLGIAAYCR